MPAAFADLLDRAAQPTGGAADDAEGMQPDRGHDGAFRRQGLEVRRREAAARILRLTDPVNPLGVSTRAFDVTWGRLEQPGCPKSEQMADDHGGWDACKRVCLGEQRPGRPQALPTVDCDQEDAVWALRVVRAHRAVEDGVAVDDLDEPVSMTAGDFDRIRVLLATAPRGRDNETPVLPSRRQVIAALDADDFDEALVNAGMTPAGRPPRETISHAEAVLLAVEHRGALPTSGEIEVFCRVHRIARPTRERPSWPDTVAQARELGAARGIVVPDAPPPLEDRPPWHEPVPALGDQGGARQWNREALLELLDGMVDWLNGTDGPLDRRFSHDNLAAFLVAHRGPDVSVVYHHVGQLEEVTAEVLDRHAAREADAPDTDRAEPTPAAASGDDPQPALEALLERTGGATLPALLRFAQTADWFTVGELDFLGVSPAHAGKLVRDLADADAIFARPPSRGKAMRYRLARPLSARAQRYVDQAPDVDDPRAILQFGGRSKVARLHAAYALAAELDAPFTAERYADHIGLSYANASKLLRDLEKLGSVRRRQGPPRAKGDGPRGFVYEATSTPPNAAVDNRRR